jgi:hypothetical protein
MLVPFENRAVVRLDRSVVGLEEPGSGHHNDIQACCNLVTTKNVSYQSFSAISHNRAAQFPGCGNPKASERLLVGEDKQRAVPAMNPDAVVVHFLKFDAASDPLVPTEPAVHPENPGS